ADGHRRLTQRLLLNAYAARALQRPGHAAAHPQLIVRGVDNRLGVPLRNVALLQRQPFAPAHLSPALSAVRPCVPSPPAPAALALSIALVVARALSKSKVGIPGTSALVPCAPALG